MGQDRSLKKKPNDFLELYENVYAAYPNLLITMKMILIFKHIVLSVNIKILVRSHINNLTVHLKALEQTEEIASKMNRLKDIIKHRDEIDKIETNCTFNGR